MSILASLVDWRLAWRELSFSGLKATLQQAPSGSWGVRGLKVSSTADSNNFKIDDPLDIFLFGRRIELEDSLLTFEFRSGQQTDVEFPDVTLENDADFHRLSAMFSVDEDLRAVALVVEGYGDPRDVDNFTAAGYLELNQFPLEKVVAAVAQDLWKKPVKGDWSKGGGVDLQLWFEGSTHSVIDFTGHFKTGNLPLKSPDGMLLPSVTKALFSGIWESTSGLNFGVKDLKLSWEELESPNLNLRVKSSVESLLNVSLAELDLDAWSDVARKSGATNNKVVGTVLNKLQPSGMLENINVQLTDKSAGYFNLKANIADVSVASWRGSPEIKHLNGFVETSAIDGRVVLDSNDGFSMFYPTVYGAPLDYDEAHGELRWAMDSANSRVLVSSGRLQLKGEDGEGNGHIYLSLPYKKVPDMEPEMTLIVGLRKSDAKYHEKYVPNTLPSSLYDWIDQAVEEGDLSNGGFIYRGSLLAEPLRPRSIQLYMDVDNGKVAFDPKWPKLESASANLLLDDMALSIEVKEATLMGTRIEQAQIELTDYKGHEASALSIVGEVSGLSPDVLELLKNSPIRDAVGSALDLLELEGAVTGDVNLLVPIVAGEGTGEQRIHVDLQRNHLSIPSLDIDIKNISGTLEYRNDTGMNAKALTGSIWGRPVVADIVTTSNDDTPETEIRFEGDVGVNSLREWTGLKEFMFAEGVSAVKGRIKLPTDKSKPETRLYLSSDLKGVEIKLPPPFGKAADATTAFDGFVNVNHAGEFNEESYHFLFGDLADVRVEKNTSGVKGISVGVTREAGPIAPGKISVMGDVKSAEFTPWIDAVMRYIDEPEVRAAANDSNENALAVQMDVKIAEASVGDFLMPDMHFQAQSGESEWLFNFTNKDIAGKYLLFEDDSPGKLDLDYVYLPEDEEPLDEHDPLAAQVSVFADFDPSGLTAMDVSIDDFKIGSEDFGAWQFDLRPKKGVLVAKNIVGTLRGLHIGRSAEAVKQIERASKSDKLAKGPRSLTTKPVASDEKIVVEESGTPDLVRSSEIIETASAQIAQPVIPEEVVNQGELRWYYSSGRPRSEFVGVIHAGNVGRVLELWEQERLMTSEEAAFDVRVSWNGFPDQLNPVSLNGAIHIDVQRGRFIKGASVGENPLVKLIGLFNFDTIARRLRLDFSDLHPEGLGYEQMVGHLDFKESRLYIEEPLIIKAPASTIQFSGEVDIQHQQLEAKLTATLPLTGNLTLAAAAIGGLPAAVGVYVVGKLFKKQVDKFSSLTYSVSGPWEDPNLEVDRVTKTRKRPERFSHKR